MRVLRDSRVFVLLVGDVWRCSHCGASGFLPARPKHEKRCRAGRRPITWSPPKWLVSPSR